MTGKRIGFDGRYINDRYHGVGRYAFGLLEALSRISPEHTFVVFRGRGLDQRFDWKILTERPNIEFCSGPWPLYWPQEQLIWPFLIRQFRIDLFHSPFIIAPFFTSKRLPILITIHDLIFDRYPQYMPQSWSFPYYRLLMHLGTRRAKKIFAVSQSTARDLRIIYGVSENKILVVSEGIDGDQWFDNAIHASRTIRQKYDLLRPYILTVGARRPHKNFGQLVEAFSRICHQLPHELVFVGPPDPRFPDDAKMAASHFSINGRARFLDWIPEKDLPAIYSQADLVILPSIIEGFGLPALEAMASGTAVMAANNSSFPEIIGSAGVLFDPNNVDQMTDVLLRTLLDSHQRKLLEQAGRQRARLCTWEFVAEKIAEVYQQELK